MKTFETRDLAVERLTPNQKLWVYNGFDCCLTLEIYHKLRRQLEEGTTGDIYNFEMALQGPAFAMMKRGLKVNLERRAALLDELQPKVESLSGMRQDNKGKWKFSNLDAPLQRLSMAFWGRPLNVWSDKALQTFFYEAMKIEPMRTIVQGKSRVTVNREALERIRNQYLRARPFAALVLSIRNYQKKIDFLRTSVDEDGRMRFSFNVAGTVTGRWSSSRSIFNKGGGQAQNITNDLRQIFEPDEGKVFIYPDLEQAEARAVAYLSGDANYIAACEGGDLHTTVAQMIWTDLGWGPDRRANREIADQKFYRTFSYRDMCKKAAHGSNYLGTPRTLGRQMKVEEKLIAAFQLKYFGGEVPTANLKRWGYDNLIAEGEERGKLCRVKGAFEGIREWQQETIDELESTGTLTTPFGRRRCFWGPLHEAKTHRDAVAFLPQSTIADLMNLAILKVWHRYDPAGVEMLCQVHDAFLGQVDEDKLPTLVQPLIEEMTIPFTVRGRECVIPVELTYGKNWGKQTEDNEDGIRVWEEEDHNEA